MKNEMNTGACTTNGANIFTGLQSYFCHIFQISPWYRSRASLSPLCACASLLMASISGFARCMRAAFFCCITVKGTDTNRITKVVATIACHHSSECATWKYSMAYIRAEVVYHESPAIAATSPPTCAVAASAFASNELNALAAASLRALSEPLPRFNVSDALELATACSEVLSDPLPNHPPLLACLICPDPANAIARWCAPMTFFRRPPLVAPNPIGANPMGANACVLSYLASVLRTP
mmetsp:Transcript_10237/g.37917  ORF Transcript_10237/g.37917 Transcript_10237/m.37917 type:complete len:238 (+) Transcript_10237:871-1584(+)